MPWTDAICQLHELERQRRLAGLAPRGLSVGEMRELLDEGGLGAPASLPAGELPPGYQIEPATPRKALPRGNGDESDEDDEAGRWLREHGEGQ